MKDQIERLKIALAEADCIIVGAGAGMSAAAGYVYDGERFDKAFPGFTAAYGFRDMYRGGFYPYKTPEEKWGFWARAIQINRYDPIPKDTYDVLYRLLRDRDYFVITTNVDHCFQRAGFDKRRLFYTQGDYGLFQCEEPCHDKTYDNEKIVQQMLARMDGLRIPSDLVPMCPVCGGPMGMNLRGDDRFVEDEGWVAAANRYQDFLRAHRSRATLFLELGVGYNTPGIIKYRFWLRAADWADATYAIINANDVRVPDYLEEDAIRIKADIHEVLHKLVD